MAGVKKHRVPFTRLTQAAVAQQELEARKIWEALEFDFTLHGMRYVRALYAPTFKIEDNSFPGGDTIELSVEGSGAIMQLIRHACRTAGSNRFQVED